MLGLGIGVLGKLLWDAFNYRPPSIDTGLVPGTNLYPHPTGNWFFTFRYRVIKSYSGVANCTPGLPAGTPPDVDMGIQSVGLYGNGVRLGPTVRRFNLVCTGSGNSPGTPAPVATVVRSGQLTTESIGGMMDGETAENGAVRYVETWTTVFAQAEFEGNILTAQGGSQPGEFAPGMQLQVPVSWHG